jgi:hypothetical protein
MITVGNRIQEIVREMALVLKEKASGRTGIQALAKTSLGAAR